MNDTIYKCPDCGLEAWGAAVTYHELATQHRSMQKIGYRYFDRWTGETTFVKFQQQGDGDSREARADREIA